jgi:hypothetical protein
MHLSSARALAILSGATQKTRERALVAGVTVGYGHGPGIDGLQAETPQVTLVGSDMQLMTGLGFHVLDVLLGYGRVLGLVDRLDQLSENRIDVVLSHESDAFLIAV